MNEYRLIFVTKPRASGKHSWKMFVTALLNNKRNIRTARLPYIRKITLNNMLIVQEKKFPSINYQLSKLVHEAYISFEICSVLRTII